jgi:hypothetical protein
VVKEILVEKGQDPVFSPQIHPQPQLNRIEGQYLYLGKGITPLLLQQLVMGNVLHQITLTTLATVKWIYAIEVVIITNEILKIYEILIDIA